MRRPSFSGGAQATIAELRDLGVSTAGLSLVDASGLSYDDRVTADQLTDMLAKAASPDHPELRPHPRVHNGRAHRARIHRWQLLRLPIA